MFKVSRRNSLFFFSLSRLSCLDPRRDKVIPFRLWPLPVRSFALFERKKKNREREAEMPGSGMLRNVPATAAAWWYLSKNGGSCWEGKGRPGKKNNSEALQ